MASVVGHTLGSLWIYSILRNKLQINPFNGAGGILVIFLLSILPDLDVLLIIIINLLESESAVNHRGLSHSLGFALLISLGVSFVLLFVKKRQNILKVFSICMSIFCLHFILDFLMGAGPQIRFFLPFHDKGFISSIKIIPTAYWASTSSGIIGIIFSLKTWIGIFLEILIFAPLIFAVQMKPINDIPGLVLNKKIYLYGFSALGVMATLILYEFGVGGYILDFLRTHSIFGNL